MYYINYIITTTASLFLDKPCDTSACFAWDCQQ